MPHFSFTNIAHRGASAYAPENTFAAFDKALELGAGHVEFDVHFSADGQVVVIHDDTVDRTTNGSGAVASLDLAQLKSLDAGSWFADEFSGERIPTLGELLERYKRILHFHIEVKGRAERLSERTIDLVRSYGWLARQVDESMVEQARQMGLTEICPHAEFVDNQLVERLHQKGFMASVWGVSDEEVMRRVVEAGADGMTINFPDRLADYLKAKPA